MNIRSKYTIATALMCLVGMNTVAQQETPSFKNLRFEENWADYQADSSDGLQNRIKHIELTDSMWVSFGGNVRIRYEDWDGFGFSDANDDDFILQRLFLHSDLHIGSHWRIFLEGKYTTVDDRDLPGGDRDALDVDKGDIWNAFVEAKYEIGNTDATFRVGRQELQYGKQRLVSPLDWANNRRIFEAALVRFKSKDAGWQVDAFASKPVVNEENHFNDHNNDVWFNGIYYTDKFRGGQFAVDAYLLTFHTFETSLPDEDRYTVGGRVVSKIPNHENLSAEVETALQLGERDDSDIEAYMFTAEMTYRWSDLDWKPWLTGGLDYASGDDDPTSGDVETFRQLFPLAHAYLGFADVVARQNVIDLRATLGAWPISKLRVRADVHYMQLAEDEDGLYGAGGTLSRPGGFDEDEIGTVVDLTAFYVINRNMNVLAGYSHVFAGDYIEASGPDDDIDFFYLQWNLKF